jgi:hypothetical protein
MGVGAVGGSMAMGGAMGMSAAPAASGMTGGSMTGATGLTGQVDMNSAPPPTTVAEFLSTPMQQAGIQQLADAMGDASFSKILFALMMLSAMEKDDKKTSGGGGAAAGFMAGLAFASQFGRNMQFDLQSPVQNVGFDGNTGANINLSA